VILGDDFGISVLAADWVSRRTLEWTTGRRWFYRYSALFSPLFPHQSYHQNAATAMIVNSFASFAAAWRHYRAGHLQVAAIKRMIPAAILAICLGVWLSNLPLFTAGTQSIYLGYWLFSWFA